MPDEIKIEGGLASLLNNLPKTGGTPDNTSPNNGGQTEADKLAATEAAKKAAADKAEADKKAAEAGGQGNQGDEDQLTDEQVQTKLDELAAKDETTLTEEEKKFIQKYTDEQLDEVGTAKKFLETKYNTKFEGTFDNSPEGLVELAEVAAKTRATQKIVELFETVPYMKEFYNHVVVEKRSLETFLDKNKQPEYKSIKIEATSDNNDEAKNNAIIANQKKVVLMELTSKGISLDRAQDLVDMYEDKGTLFDVAKESYNNLEKDYKKNLDIKLAAEKEAIDNEIKNQTETFNKVIDMIEKNNFGGVSIPSTDIKAFKEAMTKPIDDDGNTLLDYKRQKLTLEQRAILDYLVFKDLKNIGLGQAQAANKKFSFKKAADDNNARGGGRVRGAGDGGQGNQGFNIQNLDFSKIKVEHQTI